jgi:small subunit ribosomal protein S3Ae
VFPNTISGKTMAAKPTGKLAPQSCIGRRYEVNQGDLTGLNESTHRKFIFKITDVKGSEAIGSFDGMAITSDRLKSIVRKWHTTINAQTDILAKDGTVFRVFMIAVTKRPPGHAKRTCYVKNRTVREIRSAMVNTAQKELEGADAQKIMRKLSSETIGKEVEGMGGELFPPVSCCVRKVKTVKKLTEAEMQERPPAEMVEMEN